MEEYTYIYKLYDPRDPDTVRYIGKTVQGLNIRYNSHIYSARRGSRYRSSSWIQSLLKTGIKPCIKCLDVCHSKDWEFWERFYIQKYNDHSLTNIEEGGISTTLHPYTIKGTNKNAKEVEQYDLDGNFIAKYKSVAEAARQNSLNRHVIAACCRGTQTKSYGYKWKYSTDTDFRKGTHKRARKVAQYDLEGNLLGTYNSVVEASKATNIYYSGISNCVHGLYKHANNYVFKFKD